MKGIIEYVIRSVPFDAILSTIHNLTNRLFSVFLTGRCLPLSMKAQSLGYFHRVTQAPMFPVNATGTRMFLFRSRNHISLDTMFARTLGSFIGCALC